MLRDEKRREEARQQLLDEIRKRAEEAELARIEAEELKLALESRPASDSTMGTGLEQSSDIPDLRDALTLALVNNDVDLATSLYHELKALLPDDPALDQFEVELAKLRLSIEPEPASASENVQTDALYQAANDAYQKEQYDEALARIAELLSLDPANAAALELQRNVERAKHLAEQVAAEERARKEQEQRQAEQPLLPPPKTEAPEATVELPVVPAKQSPAPVQEQAAPLKEQTSTSFTRARRIADFLRRRTWAVVVAGVVALIGWRVGALIYDQVRLQLLNKRPSLLVVPTQYGQPVAAHLVHGLTDEIIARLCQVSGVDVFGATTSLRRNVSDFDGTQLAGAVGADFVLTIGMVSSPESLAVKLVLKRTSDGALVLERPLSFHHHDIARIASAVVPAVVRSLRISYPDESPTHSVNAPSPEVYTAYLVARTLLQTNESTLLDSVQHLLDTVTRQDSLFAEAFTLSGWVRILSYEASRETSANFVQQASAALQRSIGLGDNSSSVYTLWGLVAYYNGRYQEAVERMKQAVEVGPSDAEALRRLALVQARIGRLQEALDAARKSVERDPYNPSSHMLAGMLNFLLDKPAASLREFQTAVALLPGMRQTAQSVYIAALVANNRHEQALDLVKQRAAVHPDSVAMLYELGRMYQLAGKSKQLWEETLKKAKALVLEELAAHPQDPQLLSYLALIETRLGNFKQGMAASARALAAAPNDYETLYHATRVRVLQEGQTPEAYALLARAIYRRFVLSRLLDLDLLALRRDPDFIRKIAQ